MKGYVGKGLIKCGHRTYLVFKGIVADSAEQALELFLKEHPHAKNISITFKYELSYPKTPQILYTSFKKVLDKIINP